MLARQHKNVVVKRLARLLYILQVPALNVTCHQSAKAGARITCQILRQK